MHNTLVFIFTFICFFSISQITDDFSDGDFLSSPGWSGSINDFIVNTDLKLQLNNTEAAISFLSIENNLNPSLSIILPIIAELLSSLFISLGAIVYNNS